MYSANGNSVTKVANNYFVLSVFCPASQLVEGYFYYPPFFIKKERKA